MYVPLRLDLAWGDIRRRNGNGAEDEPPILSICSFCPRRRGVWRSHRGAACAEFPSTLQRAGRGDRGPQGPRGTRARHHKWWENWSWCIRASGSSISACAVRRIHASFALRTRPMVARSVIACWSLGRCIRAVRTSCSSILACITRRRRTIRTNLADVGVHAVIHTGSSRGARYHAERDCISVSKGPPIFLRRIASV